MVGELAFESGILSSACALVLSPQNSMDPEISLWAAWSRVRCGQDSVQGHCDGTQFPPFLC